ncbi:MAG TPA: alanine--tRNA ligase [Gemmatimonadales bacterium]
MRAADIRRSFLEFFASKRHTRVASSPLVPADDPTLLFTNAGMVQFKRVFQGLEQRDYTRAVTVQKCVRAGGKHNDLEQVGHTKRHLTFFEMLGNFSFGDYFKKEAIEFAWEWVTSSKYLGLDPDRLYITVHHSDDEARGLWKKVAKVSDARIYGLGDADNFWQMGDTGPCGPCSEIHYDLRKSVSGSRDLTPDQFVALAEADQLVEIWNLVFMQFDQQPGGQRNRLPAPSVDTGAGFDRLCSVLQGQDSIFHSDLFLPLIERAQAVVGKPYDRGPDGAPFRVLADHARAVSFLLADGVYPSSDGRGYVLRRILRRAVRHAYLLGRREPTLAPLAETVIDQLGSAYPELTHKRDHILKVTRAEEERFFDTIEGGLKRMAELTGSGRGTISGEDAFKLYDTYGFPIDLTQIVAGERGWSVDVEGFERALGAQQDRSRKAGKAGDAAEHGPRGRDKAGPSGDWVKVKPKAKQTFVGYETTRADTDVIAFRQAEGRLELVLKENPFYAESGGQVSDIGEVQGKGWTLAVDDVHKEDGRQVVSGSFEGPFEPTPVHADVAEQRRRDIERNHTATHLVHAALRKVLGDHVRQAGSVVDPARLRFDFSHQAPIAVGDLRAIEEEVNRGVWANVSVETTEMPYRDALAKGAMALFGEKYGDLVRVVDVPGISLELCGGTHVRSTGQIGLFHFVGESGVAAGVRRIEAVTGPGAYHRMQELEARLRETAETLRTTPEHVAQRVSALLDERRRLEGQVKDLLKDGGGVKAGALAEHKFGSVTVYVGDSPVADREQVGMLMDSFRAQHKHAAVQVLFTRGERAGIHAGVTDDLIGKGLKAGDIVSRIAALSGGKGGGRPQFASAGAGDASKLAEAESATPGVVQALLSALGVS